MLWNSLQLASSLVRQRMAFMASPLAIFRHPHEANMTRMIPQLAGFESGMMQETQNQEINNWIWFAVPKRKHTRSRKRMKTTAQKRIPLKKNIVFDPRTGEVTLKHKLPFNWKDYLPKSE